VLPVAWLTASRLLHALQLAVATVWLLTEMQFGVPWLMPFFIAAALYQVLYRRRSGALLMAALVLALFWCNLLYGWWLRQDSWHGELAAYVGLNAILWLLLFGLALTQRSHPL